MKEKIIDLFSSISIPMIIFIGICIRCIFLGATLGDALVVLGVSGVYAYNKYLDRRDDNWKRKMESQLIEIKNAVTSIKMSNSVRKAYEKKETEKRRLF